MKRHDFLSVEGDQGPYWFEHFSACMNQRYHAEMTERFREKDDFWRIAVGVIAIVGLIVAGAACLISGPGWLKVALDWLALLIAAFTLAIAYMLNMRPYKENELIHSDFHGRWTNLRCELEVLKNEIERSKGDELEPRHFEAFGDILKKKALIVADAPPLPDEVLLMKCYQDENERRNGTGIRTDIQVDEQRKKKAKEREEARARAADKDKLQPSSSSGSAATSG